MGISIGKGFHSLVEVLLQNGIAPNGKALREAVSCRNYEIVELLLQYGADVNSIWFGEVVDSSDPEIIRLFIDPGADLITDYPIAKGLTHATRLFLGIYKSCIGKYPELQFQADMALLHFCGERSLRGVSLLMWLGANPRASVPRNPSDDEESWTSPLEEAAFIGNLEIIERLRPEPAKDDLNRLLRYSVRFCRNIEVMRLWISLGADINHVAVDGASAHQTLFHGLDCNFDQRLSSLSRSSPSGCLKFALEWFSLWCQMESHLEGRLPVHSDVSLQNALPGCV